MKAVVGGAAWLPANCLPQPPAAVQYPSGAFSPYGDELLPVLAWLSSHAGIVGQGQAWAEVGSRHAPTGQNPMAALAARIFGRENVDGK